MNAVTEPTDLQRLYLEQTTKLARLTAALGIHGDEPTEALEAAAREMVQARRALIALCERALALDALSPAARNLEERAIAKELAGLRASKPAQDNSARNLPGPGAAAAV